MAVFISYSRRGEAPLADQLYDALARDGFDVRRDDHDLAYRGSISEFMAEMGDEAHGVVVVISAAYIRSPFCMRELLAIYRGRGAFRERIFPFVLPSAHDIFEPHRRLDHVGYWQARLRELSAKVSEVGAENIAELTRLELRFMKAFEQEVDPMLATIADMKVFAGERLAGADLRVLREAVQVRLTGLKAASIAPKYLSEANQRSGERLDALLIKSQLPETSEEERTSIQGEILDIKRSLRNGPDLVPGDDLQGRYRLIERIGAGGFATVWRAVDRRLGGPVAVKVLHGQHNRSEDRSERFFRGARVMARLNHPNIVRVHQARGIDGGYKFFVMEMLEGGDLGAKLKAGTIAPERLLDIVEQVAQGLAYAHSQREEVVHRDIKPENIVLTRDGRPKLNDFDLVRAGDTTGGTRTGALGTALYAAPECLEDAKQADARADVYGLAMTAVVGLSKTKPTMQLKFQPAALVAELDVSDAVRAVLEAGVQVEAAGRPANAGVWLERLRTARASAELPATARGEEAGARSFVPAPSARVFVTPESSEAGAGAPDVVRGSKPIGASPGLPAGALPPADFRASEPTEASPGLPPASEHSSRILTRRAVLTVGGAAVIGTGIAAWYRNRSTQILSEPLSIDGAAPPMPVASAALDPRVGGAAEAEGDRPSWASSAGRDAQGRWADVKVGEVSFRMRLIPAGKFTMGSPADEPGRDDDEVQHEVTLRQPFWLADAPCTQALWEAVTGSNPSYFVDPLRPVERVRFEDLAGFRERFDRLVPGFDARLPTEAEWEYACRAGKTTATYRGPIEILGERNAPVLDEIAWYGGNSGVGYDLDVGHESSKWREVQHPNPRSGSRRVKTKRPNDWGLYDMLGNVWEWCQDWYGPYSDGPSIDPTGPREGPARVRRGGSWISYARSCRAAYRNGFVPSLRSGSIGFRVSRGPAPSPPAGG